GVLDRFDRRRQAVMDEGIHAARFLGRQIAGDIETLHLARDLRAQAGGIEAGNAGDSGLAGNDIGPRLGDADSDWSNNAETGNDYSALFHRASLLCREISASVLTREADHDFSQLLRALQALEARARLRRRVKASTSLTPSRFGWSRVISAPSLVAWASLASLEDVAIVRARHSLATRIAARDTPPPIPQTRTVSPGRTPARVTTMRHAVRETSENAAASSQSRGGARVGSLARFFSGMTTYSAVVPRRCSPSPRKITHRD